MRCDGPPGFAADGDMVKIRRIAQNLVLNAVKFTREGGITVSWGDAGPNDPKRWMLSVQDTGPGIHSDAGKPLSNALEGKSAAAPTSRPSAMDSGEGIGLSIVKRLCDMLDASIELHSVEGVGTTFKILFPRHYA